MVKPLQTSAHAVNYTYDADGLRVTKTVDGVKHTYQYVGGQLRYETRGDISFTYDYDAYGNLSSINYMLADGSYLKYYVACNARGDVTAIYNSAGVLRAKYTYDSWGNTLSITDANGNAITSATHIGNLNMIRYRGYYYDSETGLYYVSSRYYDPEIGRWINADDVEVLGIEPGSLLHYNLYAYCWNNPVNMTDDNGYLPWFVAAAVGGALFDTVAYLIGSAISGQKITWAGVGKAAITGAITGVALGALGKGVKALTTAAKTTKVGVKIGATFGKMGKLVKYRKIAVNWDIITRHGLKRMSERGMSKSLINSVIKMGRFCSKQQINLLIFLKKALLL